MKKHSIIGKWRITEMDLWDMDFIDLVEEGFILFAPDETGEFRFGAVHGFMDCEYDEDNQVEFTWEGSDEMDLVSGRGWAELDGKELIGEIHFHMGDESGFTAVRARKK